MTLCAMVVVESCVVSLFVCFAEDPQALSSTKPEEYNRLAGALSEFYPQQSAIVLRGNNV